MLEREAIQATVFGRAGSIQQRRVAFPQRYGALIKSVEGQQFAIAPDSALIQQPIRSAAFTPELSERLLVNPRFDETHFQQPSAVRAIVDRLSEGKCGVALLLEAGQLG